MEIVLENAAAISGGSPPPELSDPGPAGQEIRDFLAPILRDMNIPQFAPAGLNFGYFYDASPIISYDGTEPPPYTMDDVTPSTVPGCRMPHFEVSGTPILDLLGPDYTLIRFDPTIELDAFLRISHDAGLPIVVVDAERPTVPEVFNHNLLIVRFDQHIAWRGDSLPEGSALVGLLRGEGD